MTSESEIATPQTIDIKTKESLENFTTLGERVSDGEILRNRAPAEPGVLEDILAEEVKKRRNTGRGPAT